MALEGKDGILAVSFGHGFPWADVPDVGARMLVVADGDQGKAAALAARLARELWDMREEARPRYLDVDGALDAALAEPRGPVVIADVADNAGGGAPSDSTFILRRLVERGIAPAIVGAFWDPVSVALCREAGVGAKFDLRLGGKLGLASGDPLDLPIEVLALSDNHVQSALSGGRFPFGPSARVRAHGVEAVIVSERGQVLNPDAYTELGADLAAMKVVVVKSSQHFHTAFAPIASTVLYAITPGALDHDFARLPLHARTAPWWPKVADPFR
jgi:microcystin degradation protein MlrC